MKCKECDFDSPTISDYRHHLFVKHQGTKPAFYRCHNCNLKFYNFDDLIKHRQDNQDCAFKNGINNSNDSILMTKYKHLNLLKPKLKLKRLSAKIMLNYCQQLTIQNSEKCHVCVVCKRKYHKKAVLLTHLKSIHENPFSFKCSLCDKKFNTKILLDAHILHNHTSVRPFICNLCNNGYASKVSISQHVKLCKKKYSQNEQQDHVNILKTETLCPLCDISCTNYLTLIDHLKRHKKNGIIRPVQVTKQKQQQIIIKEEEEHHKNDKQIQHQKRTNIKQKIHVCGICCQNFSTLQRLVSHKIRSHQNSISAPTKRFKKKLKINRKTNLKDSKTAIKQEETINPSLGQQQEEEEETEVDLELNSKDVGGVGGVNKNIFVCDYISCVYASTNDANLRRHKNKVHRERLTSSQQSQEEKIFYCHICPYETNASGNLKRHLCSRHEIGSFIKCHLCHFQTKVKLKLKNHLKKVHKIEPSLTCAKCKKLFKSHYEMKCHQWKHLRENTCCSNNSTMDNDDDVSFDNHHHQHQNDSNGNDDRPEEKVSLFPCSECEKTFIKKIYLQKHLQCVHHNHSDDDDD